MASSRVLLRAALIWLLQCAASGCWVASVLVYGSFEKGDRLQLAAALARHRASVAEVGVSYDPRSFAEGKKIGLRDGFEALSAMFREWRRSRRVAKARRR